MKDVSPSELMSGHGPTTTQILFSNDARRQLFAGIKLAAEAVATTLGPRGRTVIIQRQGQAPLVTKDGITVSKSINLRDPVKRMGAELVREAASHTNDVAGDGTTTATVLTCALAEGGLRLIEAGYDPLLVCRGIEEASQGVLGLLQDVAKQITTNEEVAQVGTISANGDTAIGNLIAQAMLRVGTDGIITVEDAKGMATSLHVAEGMQFDRGYLSPYFVNDQERMRAIHESTYVLVTDKKLSQLQPIIPVLEAVMRAQRPLLIIAEDVEGEALQGLVLNRVKANLPIVAIKAPGYGKHRSELLNDICVLTGGTLVSASTGVSLEKVTLAQLGQCKRTITDAKTTTLVGVGTTKEAIETHTAELRAQLADVTLSDDERTKLRMRIAMLASGIAVIRVGGATEVEMVERRFRVEDALNATRAAVEEGVIPGGGQTLYECGRFLQRMPAEEVQDRAVKAGWDVVIAACQAPFRRIVTNAGLNPDVIMNELDHKQATTEETLGYNAATGNFEDLIKAGVIDPKKVCRNALKNATSVALTFLSLDAVIHNEEPV